MQTVIDQIAIAVTFAERGDAAPEFQREVEIAGEVIRLGLGQAHIAVRRAFGFGGEQALRAGQPPHGRGDIAVQTQHEVDAIGTQCGLAVRAIMHVLRVQPTAQVDALLGVPEQVGAFGEDLLIRGVELAGVGRPAQHRVRLVPRGGAECGSASLDISDHTNTVPLAARARKGRRRYAGPRPAKGAA